MGGGSSKNKEAVLKDSKLIKNVQTEAAKIREGQEE